jgi:hypothetical protein
MVDCAVACTMSDSLTFRIYLRRLLLLVKRRRHLVFVVTKKIVGSCLEMPYNLFPTEKGPNL